VVIETQCRIPSRPSIRRVRPSKQRPWRGSKASPCRDARSRGLPLQRLRRRHAIVVGPDDARRDANQDVPFAEKAGRNTPSLAGGARAERSSRLASSLYSAPIVATKIETLRHLRERLTGCASRRLGLRIDPESCFCCCSSELRPD
jgi:hypothetical protein